MQRFIHVPLIFLFIGSLFGIFLRWQFISPVSGTNYIYFLHGHSHIMFLGWIFNGLFIGFTVNEFEHRFFKNIFIVLQALVLGMLISFPLQGYGFFSILFSTLHTLVALAFGIKFLVKHRTTSSISVWYAKVALIFFAISTAGPFSLGYLMSMGLGQSKWYYFAVYFYLHFQYNGFFLFGIISLLLGLFEKKQIGFNKSKAKTVGVILAITCLPAYLLSTLWTKPGYIYNVIGGVTSVVQLIGLGIMIVILIEIKEQIKRSFDRTSRNVMLIMVLSLTLKLILQLISAFPSIAQLAYELRPVTIAYLHLVLIGIISLGLLIWYRESHLLDRRHADKAILLFIVAFIAMEICLVITPWWTTILGADLPSAHVVTFFFSVVLSLSCLLLTTISRKKVTKISQ